MSSRLVAALVLFITFSFATSLASAQTTYRWVDKTTGQTVFSDHPPPPGVKSVAIKQGGLPLTPAKIKAGLETLKGFDSNGLIAPVTVTAKDHGGGGKTRIDMWDGTKWVPQSDWISAYADEVEKVVKEQSAEFVKSQK